MTSKISVIILNWNNGPDTLECLQSVFQSDDPNFNVIVVDNGSTDDSLAVLRETYPQVTFLEMGINLGFAEGNNRAIGRALEEGAGYVFLLNNDAIIQRSTLSILRKEAELHPNACALGPKIYFYDEPTTIWCGGGFCDSTAAFCYHQDRDLDESQTLRLKVEKTDYVCGCALFARASHLQIVGLMDPRFFLNWEEIDWCFQMKRVGFDCLYVPEAKAWHKVSSSFVGGKRGPMWHYFFSRNRLLWMEKNLPRKERWRITKQCLLPELKLRLKQTINNTEGPVARAALRGVCDYLLRRFGPGSCKTALQKK